jgi:hypothetical protein
MAYIDAEANAKASPKKDLCWPCSFQSGNTTNTAPIKLQNEGISNHRFKKAENYAERAPKPLNKVTRVLSRHALNARVNKDEVEDMMVLEATLVLSRLRLNR